MAKKVQRARAASVSRDPFGEVKAVAFTFSAKNRDDAAFLQFNLLLKPEILQAHLDFASRKGMIVCISGFDEKKELENFGLKPKLHLVEWLPYREYQKRNSACLSN